MAKQKLFDEIRQAPGRFYRIPNDVLRDRRFSDTERMEILTAWERSLDNANAAEPLRQQIRDARRDVETRMIPAPPRAAG